MSKILCSDLHFTDREKDSYRWKIFPFLHQCIKKYDVSDVYILGDLTVFKDKHSAILTNRIVNEILNLAKKVHVALLVGNHDFIQYGNPFFGFLKGLDNITYCDQITTIKKETSSYKTNEIFLPNTKTPEIDWADIEWDDFDVVYMHQCVIGSLGSQNYEMEHGLAPGYFKGKKCKVWSGDIHVPQKVGPVEYVGTPYPINIGDHYKGRCVLIDDHGKEIKSLRMKTIAKRSIEVSTLAELKEVELSEGDQVSIKLSLDPTEFAQWEELKKECKDHCTKLGVEVLDLSLGGKKKDLAQNALDLKQQKLSPQEVLKSFCKNNQLSSEVSEIGLSLL